MPVDTSVDVLNWAQDAKTPEVMTIGERTYTTRKVHEVFAPTAAAITVTTLTGLVDYVKGGDGFDKPEDIQIRVLSPSEVILESRIFGDFRQRESLMNIAAILPDIPIIGKWADQDTFITQLQACFVNTPWEFLDEKDSTKFAPGGVKIDCDFEKVARYVKNVMSVNGASFDHDGTSQEVTVKSGVANRENKILPNPVTLYPYRTFAEIEQPKGRFVFRVQKAGDDSPVFKLVEADGGAWRNKAIASVAAYLRENLPGVLVIS